MINAGISVVFCPETENDLRANKTTSLNKINSGNHIH